MQPTAPHLSNLKPITLPGGEQYFLTQQDLVRLWSRISEDETGCWIWTGPRYVAGYGKFYLRNKSVYAHRITYMMLVGPIADGLHTDHLCRVRECCNPEHLEPVSCRENIMRSPVAPAAINASKTHCKQGHSLSGSNVVINENGGRHCRTCAITAARKKYAEATGTPLNESPVDLDAPVMPRRQRGAEACAKGHVLDLQNTYVDRKGYKHCRACRAAAQSRYEARRKGK